MLISRYCAVPFYKLLLRTNAEYQRGQRKTAPISSWAPRGSVCSLKTDRLLWGERGTHNTTLLIPVSIASNTLNSKRRKLKRGPANNMSERWSAQEMNAAGGLTVCRCRSCGRRSFSRRGVCCWAPAPGSVPRPGAPSPRGSEAAPCSWSGCLDSDM